MNKEDAAMEAKSLMLAINEQKWQAFYKKTLKACMLPWHRVFFNALMMLPDSPDEEVVTGPVDDDAKKAVQACVRPWYRF